MTDQELTLDQLHAINGGAAFIKFDGVIKGERLSIVHPQYLPQSTLGIRGEKDQPFMPTEQLEAANNFLARHHF